MRPTMTIKKSRPVNGKPSQSFVLLGNTGDNDNWEWFERAGYPTIEAAQRYAEKKGWDTEIEAKTAKEIAGEENEAFTPDHKLNVRRCGIHGESTTSGRCAGCDTVPTGNAPETSTHAKVSDFNGGWRYGFVPEDRNGFDHSQGSPLARNPRGSG